MHIEFSNGDFYLNRMPFIFIPAKLAKRGKKVDISTFNVLAMDPVYK